MAGEDWKSFVRIPVRPWEGRLNFLSVDFPLMIGLRGVDYLLLALFGFCNFYFLFYCLGKSRSRSLVADLLRTAKFSLVSNLKAMAASVSGG